MVLLLYNLMIFNKLFILIYYHIKQETIPVIAIAHLDDIIKGNILFNEDLQNNNVKIDINLTGLPKNSKLGFHIHEAGDLTDGCTSACMHFNPYNETHGGPESIHRYV